MTHLYDKLSGALGTPKQFNEVIQNTMQINSIIGGNRLEQINIALSKMDCPVNASLGEACSSTGGSAERPNNGSPWMVAWCASLTRKTAKRMGTVEIFECQVYP